MSMLTNYGGKKKWIDIDWSNVDGNTIEAGMPIGADGQIHNDANAIGILVKSCDSRFTRDGEILIAGYCEEAERKTVSGVSLSSECRVALDGIALINANGSHLGNVAVAG